MKILHLIFSLEVGGTETMLMDIANIQALDADVSIAVVNNEIQENVISQLSPDVHVYKIGRIPGTRSPLPILRLNLLLLHQRFDVIHCHNSNLAKLLFKRFHKRMFLTIHTTGIKDNSFMLYKKVFAISDAVKKDISERMAIETKVVKNGINTNSITAKRILNNSLGRRVFRIVQVGRLEMETKGQNVLIDAVKRLIDNEIKVRVDFIGAGSSELALKNQVKRLGIDNHVNFLGIKDRSFIYSRLGEYDLLIQPSFVEGFGLTIVEGMLAKVLVLVSDIEGPMEIIDKGNFGYYFICGDVLDLAEKIYMVMKLDEEKKQLLIERSYMYAKEQFSIEKTAQTYLKEYDI